MKRSLHFPGVLMVLVTLTGGLCLYSTSTSGKEILIKTIKFIQFELPALNSVCDDRPGLRQGKEDQGGDQPFYGIDVVPIEDLPIVADLDIEVVGQVFAHDENPTEWVNKLDQAQKNGLKVIAWLFPQGWEWDGTTWNIDDAARTFIKTVAEHPALLAIYGLHEPYWQDCLGCGYSTQEQQLLYKQIKEIAKVPIFSAIGGTSFWTRQSQDTTFADGVCDYCAIWHYPFTSDGYERDQAIRQLRDDLAVSRKRAPKSKIVWLMQVFAQDSTGLRMPTADEMEDLACLVYESDVDGAIWYVWWFDSLYDDFLSNHPELYPIVRQIYQDYVLNGR